MKTSYEVGDYVYLRAPHSEIEMNTFKCDWNEEHMRAWEGKTARILYVGSNYCRVCLPEKYDTPRNYDDYWSWDVSYMDLASDMKEISNEEYANVLFEG